MRAACHSVLRLRFQRTNATAPLRGVGNSRTIHEVVTRTDDSSVRTANTLIDMYVKCGRLEDARGVFEGLQERTILSWNTLLLGYAENGDNENALELFLRMDREGLPFSASNFVTAIKACRGLGRAHSIVSSAKALHLLASSSGCDWDVYVGNTLIDLYAKRNSMENAWKTFERMRNHTAVSWNALILGFADNGESETALYLLWRMEVEGFCPTTRSFVAAFKACTDLATKENRNIKVQSKNRGKALHLLALSSGCDSDMFLGCTFLDMCAKCGSMEDACRVFDSMRYRDVVTWNALMFGYAENGEAEKALQVFVRMRLEGYAHCPRSFVASLKACSELVITNKAVENCGKVLHLLSAIAGCDSDVFVENTLVDLYANSSSMVEARSVFNRMRSRNIVSWNALSLGYAVNGEGETALELFVRMQAEDVEPDSATFIAIAKACIDVADKEQEDYNLVKVVSRGRGNAIHSLVSMSGWDSAAYVGNTLLDMYAKCGSMEDARSVFDLMKHRDVVSWNALIFGYTRNDEAHLVLELYSRMRSGDCEPDSCTLVAALKACGKLGALEAGRTIHTEVLSRGFENDGTVANSLVDFYARCGSLTEARHAFEVHPCRDMVTWSSLMAGYSRHGDTRAVFDLFEMMQEFESLQPNCITFSCILAVCSHAGLVDKGKHYFEVMSSKYGIEPDEDHYTSMIDILGRANKLNEAMVLLRSMANVGTVTWTSVLGSCRKWKKAELGRLAFESLVSLDEKNVGAYALMGSLYGSKGMWERQAEVKAVRDNLRVVKKPGQSWWTNREGRVQTFMVGTKSHPQCREINEKLREVSAKLKEHGYVAKFASITRHISDGEKEDALCGHSERLALACALINTSSGETIRIFKNLRVCDDCHATTAFISKLEQRTILCRDASRFHVFRDGECSCGDFW